MISVLSEFQRNLVARGSSGFHWTCDELRYPNLLTFYMVANEVMAYIRNSRSASTINTNFSDTTFQKETM